MYCAYDITMWRFRDTVVRMRCVCIVELRVTFNNIITMSVA